MDSSPAKEPSPAAEPSTPRTHHRRPSKFVSPVNLPIRSDERVSASPQTAESPKFKPSPRRSFYQERSIPVTEEEILASVPPLTPPQGTQSQEFGLIFDDGDERLPPPEASPTVRPVLEADVLAISSPTLSPGAAAELDDSAYDDGPAYSFQLLNGRRRSSIGSYGALQSNSRRNSDPLSISGLSTASSYYPTPIPAQLMRPPRLSKRPPHRKSSLPLEDIPPPPEWGPSPLEEGIEYQLSSAGSVSHRISSWDTFNTGLDDEPHASDVNSDCATIRSDDRDDLDAVSMAGTVEYGNRRSNYNYGGNDGNDDDSAAANGVEDKASSRKRSSWLPKLFRRRNSHNNDEEKDEMGEKFDAKEAQTLLAQMAVLDDDVAFSRLDPEAIQRHSQMFDAGGVHNSITPRSGGPTSLIEELEIRKAGKKVQRQVFFREMKEMERQRAEDALTSKNHHPADLIYTTQPTLLQMQQMAQVDYDARVKWHTRAINHNYIDEHSGETLAQRRARLKAEKMNAGEAERKPQETLAQRRQRLRKQRELAAIKQPELQTETHTANDSPHTSLLNDSAKDTNNTVSSQKLAISAT